MSTATPPVRALLPDGEVAWVRTLEARDAAAVLALRARVSGRDRHLRFFGLGVAGLAELSTQLSRGSGVGHTAVGCFLHSRLVGIARYDILTDPAEAQVALAVDGHGPTLGVAALLLEQLVVSAEHEGVRMLVADVDAGNAKMLGVFAALGIPFRPGLPGRNRSPE
ncbi:GNAT family N-acetyltransferase [Amycolatopsis sp. FBCC-B4732]|uniref:GNAT family N-acetyltransferase n=1 Tax=Amycolatopsis sp. FBCC-B4732 TaxID=3079339 RepID=UPI001FF56BF1|nr:GNAT family N-acetyltransferase [Amycolatopsis sp. FBCC-B4732]UOX90487.1 GNAT family N-acetyltransferase [Amycolatopsis sp. FBCC-B4732]